MQLVILFLLTVRKTTRFYCAFVNYNAVKQKLTTTAHLKKSIRNNTMKESAETEDGCNSTKRIQTQIPWYLNLINM
jgi:hypothetical protein